MKLYIKYTKEKVKKGTKWREKYKQMNNTTSNSKLLHAHKLSTP